jgi:hypothetical protein
MTTVWDNPLLSIKQLQEKARVDKVWLNNALDDPKDPIPSTQRGIQRQVLWSDYYEWLQRNYGNGGPLRGSEYFNLNIKPKKKAEIKKVTEQQNEG